MEDFIIYGEKNSAAEKYATNNRFTFKTLDERPFEKGDADCDGSITSADALNVLQIVTGLANMTDEQKNLADLDGDGQVTSADALIILQIVTGLK